MKEKKQSDAKTEKYKSTAEYYELKTDAVERLVGANEENSPEVSQAEIDKYRGKKKLKIPPVLGVLFLKFWFSGATCFFFFWGLAIYIKDMLDLLFVIGFAMGVITDLLTNNILRYFAPSEGAFDKYMMFPKKKLWTLFLNIIYAYAVLACVVWAYQIVNTVIVSLSGAADGAVPLGVEPIMFGLFYLGFDMLFIGMKNMFMKIVCDAERRVGGK